MAEQKEKKKQFIVDFELAEKMLDWFGADEQAGKFFRMSCDLVSRFLTNSFKKQQTEADRDIMLDLFAEQYLLSQQMILIFGDRGVKTIADKIEAYRKTFECKGGKAH